MLSPLRSAVFFFFNDTATTEIYTLSLHDALPISLQEQPRMSGKPAARITDSVVKGKIVTGSLTVLIGSQGDRKSTRLNSSHQIISYAVFCFKKKKIKHNNKLHITNHPWNPYSLAR